MGYSECGVADFFPICDQKKKSCGDKQVKRPPLPVCVGCNKPQPHESVPEWKKCVQFWKAFGNHKIGCEPADIPEDCPVDSWLQLFGECGVAKLKLCSELD